MGSKARRSDDIAISSLLRFLITPAKNDLNFNFSPVLQHSNGGGFRLVLFVHLSGLQLACKCGGVLNGRLFRMASSRDRTFFIFRFVRFAFYAHWILKA